MIKVKDICSFSCQGARDNQEDFVSLPAGGEPSRIFVVCDGMGGHGHGEVASEVIANAVYSYLKELSPRTYSALDLQCAVDFAVEELQAANHYADDRPMGTTLVVAVVNEDSVLVGHVGDSRCYQLRHNGQLVFRSKDHSKVQEAVDAEILTEDEARSSSKKNILTRCILATSTQVEVEVDTLRVRDGDVFVLCTDGVVECFTDSDLEKLASYSSVALMSEKIQAECALNSHDNYSGIVLSVSYDGSAEEPETTSGECVDEIEFCAKCGSVKRPGDKFCPYCGYEYGHEQVRLQTNANVAKTGSTPGVTEVLKGLFSKILSKGDRFFGDKVSN